MKARVVQDPSEGSIDFSGSIDMDYADDIRREMVERDTAESLRKTIAVRVWSIPPIFRIKQQKGNASPGNLHLFF